MKIYAVAVLAVVLLSLGQVLLKLLAVKVANTDFNLANWYRDAFNLSGLVAAACVIYAAVLACWLYVLKSTDLNRAFSFAALTFILVPLFSYLMLGEKISLGTVAGSTLIVVGILLSANY